MKKVSVLRFFGVYFSFTVISNFVHPITPMFLQSINCPDYMFGAAFAAMAFANFLSSPLWGRLGDRYGYAKMMGIGYLGYSLGQYLFSIAQNSFGVVLARVVGGFFICGLTVNAMAYLVSMTDDGQVRGKYLAMFAALQSVGAAGGYLIGGLIGDWSMQAVFYCQVGGVAIAALLTMLLLGEVVTPAAGGEKLQLSDVNPFTSLAASAKTLTVPMGIFLVTVFLSAFATFAHDNSFNYFLRVQLDFPPSGNGIFKAVVGVIAIVANSTINMWLARRFDGRKSIAAVLGLCAVSLFAMVSVAGVPLFLATALVYYTFSVIYLPIQQVLVVRNGGDSSKGAISGLFNAARSLGMMAGPLFAGFVFGVNPIYPFIGAAVAFGLAAALCLYNAKQFERQEGIVDGVRSN